MSPVATLLIFFCAGVVLILIGHRGRRITAAPRCMKCNFDVTGIDEAGRCPECGKRLVNNVSVVTRERRRGLILIGIVVIFLPFLYRSPGMPASIVVQQIRLATVDWSRDDLIAGLIHRDADSQFSDHTVAAFVDALLDIQRDHDTYWNAEWGDFIERAYDNGRIDAARWRRYAAGAVMIDIKQAGRVPLGNPPLLEVHARDRAGTAQRFVTLIEHEATTIDGKPHWTELDDVVVRGRGRAVIEVDWKDVSPRFGPVLDIQALTFAETSTFRPDDYGVYALRSTWRKTIIDRMRADSKSAPIVTSDEIGRDIHIIPMESRPRWVESPEVGEAIRDYLETAIRRWGPIAPLPSRVRVGDVPLVGECDFYLDLYVDLKGEEIHLGRVYQRTTPDDRGVLWSIERDFSDFPRVGLGRPFRNHVICRPNPDAAYLWQDDGPFWNGEPFIIEFGPP